MAHQYQTNEGQKPTFAPSMLYLLIATNSIGPIFRAFSSGNKSLLAFIFFVYSSFFLLEYCFLVYQRFPRNENPPQKKLLAVVIWLLFSGIMFGLSYQFAAHFYLVFDVILYAIAFVASAIIFYVYIIYNNKQCFDQNSCADEKIVFSEVHFDVVLEKV